MTHLSISTVVQSLLFRMCFLLSDVSVYLFLFEVGVIDFSMYLKNDIDDYRSEERYDLLLSLRFIQYTGSL